MSYITPTTTWSDSDVPTPSDFNRIEGNTEYIAGNGSQQQLGTSDDVQFADVSVDSLTSGGDVSGTTGTFSGAVSGTTGTFSGAVNGTTGTFSGGVSGTTGTFSGGVSGTTGTFSGNINPTESPTAGTFPVGEYLLPRGIYNISLVDTSSRIFMYNGSDWKLIMIQESGDFDNTFGGCLFSDGANIKVRITSGTGYYQKY